MNVAGDTQLTLDTLLGSSGLFELVVGLLQLGVGSLEPLGGIALVEGIDGEEGHDEYEGDAGIDETLVGETLFLLGNLGFFLLSVVDSSEFGGIVLFGTIDSAVEGITDLCTDCDS